MKHYILISFLSTVALYAAVPVVTSPTVSVTTTQPNEDKELAWVDEQILAILPTRVGVADGFINSLRDPMKMKNSVSTLKSASGLLSPPKLGILSQPKIVEEPLRLLAIMNKSVLINGKWYKAGDSIRTFTLAEIKPNSVLLTGKKDQKLILFLTKQNSNIKIITK
ncbi:MAG: hypothetical protein JZU62_09305 [Sulfuricurvum sp.]|uniref:hypothetical protein n=1 Tax=Sulfuricurvum sp. TaxID=2025608 RepID=UPI0025D9FC5C|nr:hypothetical protein [Sulfuricurvum sp.]MBV5321873.1 hypothetical protein [Sulfuricurvum sp.]